MAGKETLVAEQHLTEPGDSHGEHQVKGWATLSTLSAGNDKQIQQKMLALFRVRMSLPIKAVMGSLPSITNVFKYFSIFHFDVYQLIK